MGARLKIDILTIFPGLFPAFLAESFVGIARERGLLEASVHDLRDWTADPHRSVDDAPYGGGPGMVMKPEPLVRAIEAPAGPKGPERQARVIRLSPPGRRPAQAGPRAPSGLRPAVLGRGRSQGVRAGRAAEAARAGGGEDARLRPLPRGLG